jgi:uncharacterized repeat protein (TIGR04042 family)
MPELHFSVQWPDGSSCSYYSPSTTVRDHLTVGTRYSVSEFVTRARTAMHVASERVRAKFGYTCSSAMDTLAQIEAAADSFDSAPDARVTVLAIGGAPARG